MWKRLVEERCVILSGMSDVGCLRSDLGAQILIRIKLQGRALRLKGKQQKLS